MFILGGRGQGGHVNSILKRAPKLLSLLLHLYLYIFIVEGLRQERMAISMGHTEEEMNNTRVLQLKQNVVERVPDIPPRKSGKQVELYAELNTHTY